MLINRRHDLRVRPLKFIQSLETLILENQSISIIVYIKISKKLMQYALFAG